MIPMKFRWPWKKRAPLPTIPPYVVPVAAPAKEKAPGIVVEEHAAVGDDADLEALRRAQTQTGIHRAWDRLTGKFKQ